MSIHHDDYASAAIYSANCGLSFSLLRNTASCSQIFGKLKGQLCCKSMIFHDPSCSNDYPNTSRRELLFRKWLHLVDFPLQKREAALASQRYCAGTARQRLETNGNEELEILLWRKIK